MEDYIVHQLPENIELFMQASYSTKEAMDESDSRNSLY
jgi:hypothetical protein